MLATLRVPVLAPAADGAKRTSIVQEAPWAMIIPAAQLPELPPAITNSLVLVARVPRVTLPGPALLTDDALNGRRLAHDRDTRKGC